MGTDYAASWVLDFGAATGDQYRKTIEAPFFEKYLKGRAGFDLQGVAMFQDWSEQVGAI